MKRIEFYSALGFALCWTLGCSQSTQTVQSQRSINWMKADKSANTAAEDAPVPKILPETYYAAAQLSEKQGQIASAVIQYQKAVSVNHNFVAAYSRLGVLLGRAGRHVDAEAALRRAVELAPDRAFLHNNLGYEFALQSRWSEAEAEFREALRLTPDFVRAHVNLGLALAQQERYEEALASFDAVLPEADAYYNLGLMFRGQHRYRDAADAFERVLAINPQFTAARRQLDEIQPRLELSSALEPVANVQDWSNIPVAAETATEPVAAVAGDSLNDAATVAVDPEDMVECPEFVGPPYEPDEASVDEMLGARDEDGMIILPDDEP